MYFSLLFILALMGVAELAKGIQYQDPIKTGYLFLLFVYVIALNLIFRLIFVKFVSILLYLITFISIDFFTFLKVGDHLDIFWLCLKNVMREFDANIES